MELENEMMVLKKKLEDTKTRIVRQGYTKEHAETDCVTTKPNDMLHNFASSTTTAASCSSSTLSLLKPKSEIDIIEKVDLNYNVKVSGKFSPLL